MTDQVMQNAQSHLQACFDEYRRSGGKKASLYEVIIRPEKQNESDRQRGGYHLLCKIFGDEFGYTIEEVKQIVTDRLYGYREIELLGHRLTVPDIPDDLGDRQRYIEQINMIYQIGAEEGIELPELKR